MIPKQSIIYFITSEYVKWLFVDLHTCFGQISNLKLSFQFCKSKRKQFHVQYSYKTRKPTVINFWLSWRTMDQSRNLLALRISLNIFIFFPFSDNSLLKRSHLLPWSQICLLLFLTRYRHHNRWPIHVCLPRERNQLPICPFCLACFHGFGNTLPITAISHWRPRFVVFDIFLIACARRSAIF